VADDQENIMRDPRFFERLEKDERELLQKLREGWSEDEIAAVGADIDFGEWDLAIEQIAGAIVRLNKPLTPDLLTAIDDLAARLNLSGNEQLRALHARARRLGIERGRSVARAR
jgi:hypothetical protein